MSRPASRGGSPSASHSRSISHYEPPPTPPPLCVTNDDWTKKSRGAKKNPSVVTPRNVEGNVDPRGPSAIHRPRGVFQPSPFGSPALNFVRPSSSLTPARHGSQDAGASALESFVTHIENRPRIKQLLANCPQTAAGMVPQKHFVPSRAMDERSSLAVVNQSLKDSRVRAQVVKRVGAARHSNVYEISLAGEKKCALKVRTSGSAPNMASDLVGSYLFKNALAELKAKVFLLPQPQDQKRLELCAKRRELRWKSLRENNRVVKRLKARKAAKDKYKEAIRNRDERRVLLQTLRVKRIAEIKQERKEWRRRRRQAESQNSWSDAPVNDKVEEEVNDDDDDDDDDDEIVLPEDSEPEPWIPEPDRRLDSLIFDSDDEVYVDVKDYDSFVKRNVQGDDSDDESDKLFFIKTRWDSKVLRGKAPKGFERTACNHFINCFKVTADMGLMDVEGNGLNLLQMLQKPHHYGINLPGTQGRMRWARQVGGHVLSATQFLHRSKVFHLNIQADNFVAIRTAAERRLVEYENKPINEGFALEPSRAVAEEGCVDNVKLVDFESSRCERRRNLKLHAPRLELIDNIMAARLVAALFGDVNKLCASGETFDWNRDVSSRGLKSWFGTAPQWFVQEPVSSAAEPQYSDSHQSSSSSYSSGSESSGDSEDASDSDEQSVSEAMTDAGSDQGATSRKKRTRGGEEKDVTAGSTDASGLSTNRSSATGVSQAKRQSQSSSPSSAAAAAPPSTPKSSEAEVLTQAFVEQKRATSDAQMQKLIGDEEELRKAFAKLDAEEAKLMRHQIDRTRRLKLKLKQQTLSTHRLASSVLQAEVVRMERELKILLQRTRLELACVLQDLLLLPKPGLVAVDADYSNAQSLVSALRMEMFEEIGGHTNVQLMTLVEEAESGQSNWLTDTPLEHIYLMIGLQREAASRLVALTPSSPVERIILSHGRRATHFAIDL